MSDYWHGLILASIILEVIFLSVIEYRIWKSLYTPLNILMLPYTVVLCVSIVVVNALKLYPFCYESIFIWSIGLLVFAIPSWVCGFFHPKYQGAVMVVDMTRFPSPKSFFWSVWILLLMYGYHIKSVLGSSAFGLGSDEFAEEASGGFWSHILVLVMVAEVLCFLYLCRKRWYFIFPILVCIVFCVFNQVKGWVIIPLLCVLLLKLFTGKLHISLRIVVLTVIGGFTFFFLSYYLSLVFSEDKEFSNEVLTFILRNFFHYFSSGVLGLSMDVDHGLWEQPSVEYLFTPFANIVNLFTGDEMLSNLNTYYLQPTWSGFGSNIRSFMGTIFVFGREYSPLVVLLYSGIIYAIYFYMNQKRTLEGLLISSWMCAFLFMGWFDYYFALLIPFEVMVLFFLWVKAVSSFNVKTVKTDGDKKL